jgi:hypothetical protein
MGLKRGPKTGAARMLTDAAEHQAVAILWLAQVARTQPTLAEQATAILKRLAAPAAALDELARRLEDALTGQGTLPLAHA